MISMFAMILSLGIIVDDAIVVSERHASLTRWMPSATASKISCIPHAKAHCHIVNYNACSLLPLLFISGVAGQFLREIPIVVITVIIASIIECFLILPKHLSTIKTQQTQRTKFLIQFRAFRIKYFSPRHQSRYPPTLNHYCFSCFICVFNIYAHFNRKDTI